MESEIGQILPDGSVEKEYFGQGYIYKNYDNFEKKSGPCYISEYQGVVETNNQSYTKNFNDMVEGEDYETYNTIVAKVKDAFRNSDIMPKDYFKDEELEGLAQEIFDELDWQFVTSLADEWLEGYEESYEEGELTEGVSLTEKSNYDKAYEYLDNLAQDEYGSMYYDIFEDTEPYEDDLCLVIYADPDKTHELEIIRVNVPSFAKSQEDSLTESVEDVEKDVDGLNVSDDVKAEIKSTIADYDDWKESEDDGEMDIIDDYVKNHYDNPLAEVIINWYEGVVGDDILENDLNNLNESKDVAETTSVDDYLGITDNTDEEYKDAVRSEYNEMVKRYAGKGAEYCLIDDYGTYDNGKTILGKGKYIIAFTK